MSNFINEKPRTIVFVDYESWFWGMYNKHGEKPDVKTFIQDVKKRSILEQVYFFGDFTKEEMQKERTKLRTITNNIIDCANQETKKDYTDFIMLDNIYKTILQQPEIEQYILVTGDGHFHSVVAYLTTFKDKKVGIYGVHGSFSSQLKECATWWEEFKPINNFDFEYRQKILETINWAERQARPAIVPTFKGTVEACSKHNQLDKVKVTATLSKLIEDGYIGQSMKTMGNGYELRALITNWDLLIKHGIWAGVFV